MRELLDELIQNELASTVVDGILFEAVHDMLPSIVIESMVSAQADVLQLEILEEVVDQQMHVVAADFIRRMNDQRRVAAKCENTRVGEQLVGPCECPSAC